MGNPAMPDEKFLDEKITEFADQVLGAGKEIAMNETETTEFSKLQKAIIQMKAAVDAAQPDDRTRERIRKNVLKTARKTSGWHTKLFSMPWKIPGIALAGASAVIVLAGILMTSTPTSGGQLVGTAESSTGWFPVIIIASIIVIAVFIWVNRQR